MSNGLRPIPCNPATRNWLDEMFEIICKPSESDLEVARIANGLRVYTMKEEVKEVLETIKESKPTVGFSSGCGAAQTRGF